MDAEYLNRLVYAQLVLRKAAEIAGRKGKPSGPPTAHDIQAAMQELDDDVQTVADAHPPFDITPLIS